MLLNNLLKLNLIIKIIKFDLNLKSNNHTNNVIMGVYDTILQIV